MGEAKQRTLARQTQTLTLDTFGGRVHVEWDPAAAVSMRMRTLCVASKVLDSRNGPKKLDRAVSEIFIGFQAASLLAACSKYTASGVRRSSAL